MTSKLHESCLSLLGKDISPVQSAKDLGVILDSNLTFNIRKLQAVQNFECRIVSGARKYDHVTPHLRLRPR